MYIYADNAATTRMSDAAVAAMGPYFQEIYGNPSSLHSIGQRAAEALDDARGRIAACLGAQKQEIYFTSGGSEADNQALLSAAAIGARRGKRHIISSAFEHHAVLHTLDKLRRDGFEIDASAGRPGGDGHGAAGGGRHPAGHLPGQPDVRQQRDRVDPAHRRDRRGLPGKGRAVPHGCGAGGGASAHRRRSAAY